MKRSSGKIKKLDKYLIFGLGIIAAVLVLAATSKYGAGLSPDAVAYLYAAESFKDGRGFLYFGYSTPMIQWPPLFPAVIALVSALGLSAAAAARVINAVVFGLTVVLSGFWFRNHIRFIPLAITGTLAVLLSVPLLTVSGYAWSEPLFVFLVVSFLLSTEKYFIEGKKKSYWLSALFAAMACLARYVGVIGVLTGAVLLLLKEGRITSRIKEAFIFGLVSGIPLSAWAIRNYIHSSTLFGNRTPSVYTLGETSDLAFRTVMQWFIPLRQLDERVDFNLALWTAVVLAVAVLAIIAALIAIARLNRLKKWNRVNVAAWSRQNIGPVLPAALFVVFYCAYMVYTASSVAFDRINDRLMCPVYIPLIFLMFYMLDNIPILFYRYLKNRVLNYALLVLAALWLVYPACGVYRNVERGLLYGIGMKAETGWTQSELMKELPVYAKRGAIYTNFAERTYAHAGIFSEYVPRKGSLPEYGLEAFLKKIDKGGDAYLAWFEREGMLQTLLTPGELEEYLILEPVFKADDGVLYRIDAR